MIGQGCTELKFNLLQLTCIGHRGHSAVQSKRPRVRWSKRPRVLKSKRPRVRWSKRPRFYQFLYI